MRRHRLAFLAEHVGDHTSIEAQLTQLRRHSVAQAMKSQTRCNNAFRFEPADELEQTRRGMYAGGVGYFDFSGNMDMCIAIRTMFAVNGKIYFQAGAGIVADSDPEKEFQETLNKSRALVEALKMAERIS